MRCATWNGSLHRQGEFKNAFIRCLDWEKAATQSGNAENGEDSIDSPSQNEMQDNKQNSLLPVIAQSVNGEVMMMGYANQEALEKTFDTGKLTFFSRSRQKLWTKGETSGHFLEVVEASRRLRP